jgi:hypothetical protein
MLDILFFTLWQFDGIGYHGTKIIIFNLWFNDDGNLELDFDTDPEVVVFVLLILLFLVCNLL